MVAPAFAWIRASRRAPCRLLLRTTRAAACAWRPWLPQGMEAVAQTPGDAAERVLSLPRSEPQVVRQAALAEGDARIGRVLSAEIRGRWSAFSGAALCDSLHATRRRPVLMLVAPSASVEQRAVGVPYRCCIQAGGSLSAAGMGVSFGVLRRRGQDGRSEGLLLNAGRKQHEASRGLRKCGS